MRKTDQFHTTSLGATTCTTCKKLFHFIRTKSFATTKRVTDHFLKIWLVVAYLSFLTASLSIRFSAGLTAVSHVRAAVSVNFKKSHKNYLHFGAVAQACTAAQISCRVLVGRLKDGLNFSSSNIDLLLFLVFSCFFFAQTGGSVVLV